MTIRTQKFLKVYHKVRAMALANIDFGREMRQPAAREDGKTLLRVSAHLWRGNDRAAVNAWESLDGYVLDHAPAYVCNYLNDLRYKVWEERNSR